MVYVSVDDSLVNFHQIDKIAKAISIFEGSKQQIYANFLGHYGGLDNNIRAKECGISKLHIALNEKEMNSKKWHLNQKRPQNRTSNSFVVFVRHWLYDDYVRILDIVSPDAHERIDALIPKLVDKAETFFNLGKSDLNNLVNYIADDLVEGKRILK